MTRKMGAELRFGCDDMLMLRANGWSVVQGLQSHRLASRAGELQTDAPEAEADGVMQNIYEGLDEANSILERFCNRHQQGSPSQATPMDMLRASDQAMPSLEYEEQAYSDGSPDAYPSSVILDTYSQHHSRTSSGYGEGDQYHHRYSPGPILLNAYPGTSPVDAPTRCPAEAPEDWEQNSRWVVRSATLAQRRPEVILPSEAVASVRAVMKAGPQGCVGWFMHLDSDCQGYVSTPHMIDAALLLPCRLTSDQALDFVASIPGSESHRITLSSLWTLLNCPGLLANGSRDADVDCNQVQLCYDSIFAVRINCVCPHMFPIATVSRASGLFIRRSRMYRWQRMKRLIQLLLAI